MAGLIERIARTSAVLRQPTGAFEDGKPVMASVPCVVFGLGGEAQAFNEFGQVQSGRVFLVAPLPETPVLPGTITVGGATYGMASVKEYRNLDGVLLGYRIAVTGA